MAESSHSRNVESKLAAPKEAEPYRNENLESEEDVTKEAEIPTN